MKEKKYYRLTFLLDRLSQFPKVCMVFEMRVNVLIVCVS